MENQVVKYFADADKNTKYNVKLTPAQILVIESRTDEQNPVDADVQRYLDVCRTYNRENYKLTQRAAVQSEQDRDIFNLKRKELETSLQAKEIEVQELKSEVENIAKELTMKEAYSIREDRSKTQNQFLVLFLKFAFIGLFLVLGAYLYVGSDVMASLLGSYIGAFLSLGGTAAAFMFGGNNSSSSGNDLKDAA